MASMAWSRCFPSAPCEPPIDPELAGVRVVTDVAGLDQDQVLAVIRMRAMSIDGDDAPDAAVVEGEAPKC